MSETLTNAWTYIPILFLLAVLVGGMNDFGLSLLAKDFNGQINLSNSSKEYITSINYINLSSYEATKAQLQDPVSYKYNSTSGTPKDFSIEFFYAQEKSTETGLTIKRIYNWPSHIIVTVLRLPGEEFKSVINNILWLLSTAIFFAIIYFIRAVVTKR